MVAGSRCTKSKMPWPPGSRPVMKVDQATGLCGGMVVPRRLKSPSRRRRSRLGSEGQWRSRKARIHAIDAQHDQLFGELGGARPQPPAASGGCDQNAGGYADANTGLPSIHSGVAMPKRSSAVGARSSIPGSSASMARFENSTPGTSGGSIE